MFFTVSGQGDFNRIKSVFDPARVAVFLDHAVPAPTLADAEGAAKARAFVKKRDITHFYDVGHHGVIHQRLAEEGFALPGLLLACGDSHTCAAGAFNCAARGFGPADMIYVLCTGQNWYQVAGTIRFVLRGSLPDRVTAKDVFLFIAGEYGDVIGRNVEFGGDGLKNLSIASRQSIATMCAEINAEFAVFPYDDIVEAYISGKAKTDWAPVYPDEDAVYESEYEINMNDLVPYISGAHYIPGNCRPVSDSEGLPIDQAVLGSCSNGRIEDLALAADMIRGHKVADGVRFIVTPATQGVYTDALEKGYLATLAESGAVVTNATCGICYGGHMGMIGAGERCVTTTTRNFKGRMGSPDSEILLAGPSTVVASAVMGKIADPRMLQER
jgi:3-isopropylmalate/(R)-2-methylmalate dehydratase large subunit